MVVESPVSARADADGRGANLGELTRRLIDAAERRVLLERARAGVGDG